VLEQMSLWESQVLQNTACSIRSVIEQLARLPYNPKRSRICGIGRPNGGILSSRLVQPCSASWKIRASFPRLTPFVGTAVLRVVVPFLASAIHVERYDSCTVAG
jgi:hypothetical protein